MKEFEGKLKKGDIISELLSNLTSTELWFQSKKEWLDLFTTHHLVLKKTKGDLELWKNLQLPNKYL
ncbi:MAG: hypothetical protein R3B55_01950 [Candidatus Paceibacterota bacterium]